MIESLIWHPPAGFMALCGEGSEKEQCPLPAPLSGKKLSPSSCPDAAQFSSSLYFFDVFQAAVLALELRGTESKLSLCVSPLRETA